MALAYAALVSLMNVLNRVQHPTCHGSLDISQVKSLSDKVSSLVDLLEAYSHRISEGLDRKMTDAAFAAEDTIESYLVGILRSTSNREVLNENLDKVIEEMDSLIQEAMQAKEKGEKDELSRNSVPGAGTPVHPSEAMEMVGFEEETNYLIGQLTARQPSRQVIPIVGMGGLGKTTLATSIYNHPHLRHQFDVKAWVTVSQVYMSRSIILPVLRCLGIDEKDHIGDNELGVRLHKELWSRKYLIVLDDIWDSQAWDEISRFCPDNNNGSRILLTTRRSDVATSVGSCSPFELQLLDGDKSWVLLSNKVFGQEVCPPELESCGKKIAMNCKGLPLAIAVIGGLLKMSIQIRERWEHVERDTRSMVSVEDDEHCMKILSLSYHQLPVHLKPCLLYMATFPEDYEICVSEVTKLWAADGFLKANVGGESLEDVAIRCLTDLVSRNLMMVRKRNHRGGIKCLTVHDLVRVLCIKEAEKMKFLYVDAGVIRCLDSIECQRRVVSHANGSMLYRDMLQTGFCRSFIWFQRCNLTPEISSSPLLRVLFAPDERLSVEGIMQLVNLQFLKFTIDERYLSLFSSVSWSSNLETLIVDDLVSGGCSLPCEIWKLRNIKHLVFSRHIILPDPPTGDDFVLEKLVTLKGVEVLSDKVLDRIPIIRRLKIYVRNNTNKEEDLSPLCFGNLVHCGKLESLMFHAFDCDHLKTIRFPCYLRKLTLYGTRIPWGNMTILSSLPHLSLLRLEDDAFEGKEWNSVEGEFVSLRYLSINDCSLVSWIVEDASHFPCLEHLNLAYMDALKEIPEVFAELMTLASIKLHFCSKSVVISARQILEEQRQFMGGCDVTVVHSFRYTRYAKKLEAELKRELDRFPVDTNFHLEIKKDETSAASSIGQVRSRK